jgi:dihydrofolate synthase/folylpolyglutamate synthase
MSFDEMMSYFQKHNYSTYERDNYDRFLEKMKFDFPIKSIHITGSNGKGSTANFLYNAYLANGYKVGLYTSPYLEDVTEMISVNGKHIDKDEYLALFNEFKDAFEKYSLSSFEMQTYIAFTYFIRQGLDLVIIEVGMGGFIDATNVIDNPLLAIITNISLEHTAYLGRSISEIAYNKAGIIKEETPVLVGKVDDSAMFAIREYARDMDAPIHVVDDFHNEHLEGDKAVFDYYPFKNVKVSSKAFYQCKNASLALEAINILKEELPFDEAKVKEGMEKDILPCRLEYIKDNLILDGGHNPDGINNLCETLEKIETRPIHVVFASFKDKNIENMLIPLSNMAADVTLTTFDHPRARGEEEYFLYLGDYEFNADYLSLIKDKLAKFPNDVVLVTGSLAFVGRVKQELKL